MEINSKPRRWSWLLLFTTSGTLLCCAIPITLVSLGCLPARSGLTSGMRK